MAWFKLEETFPRHPKVRKLADRLGLSMIEARGHLATLWCWVCGYAPDGDLESFDEDDIELAAEWEGERGAFIEACRQVGLIDEHEDGYEIHEWMERAESFKRATQKRKEREGKKGRKTRARRSRDSTPTVGPERRGEDREERTERTERSTHQTGQGRSPFDQAWDLVPRKEGKKAARRAWNALVKQHPPEDLIGAVERYAHHVKATKTEPRFTKQGSTLFNNLEDWLQRCPMCRGKPCGVSTATGAQRVAIQVIEERRREARDEEEYSPIFAEFPTEPLPDDGPPS